MYRTVLVDDEPLALKRLRRLLESHDDTIHVVGTANNGADAVAVINDLRPDLVFLDIQMPELNGFDVLERLDYLPLVIFSTAFDQYALKAFEVNSIDYLLKPVDPERLEKAVSKLHRIAEGGAKDLHDRIKNALASLPAGQPVRFPVRIGDRIRLVPAAEVVFFRAADKYVELHTQDSDYLLTRSLAKLEAELPSADFVRVHRSVVVNVNYIDEIAKGFKGGWIVRMKDNNRTELPVSRRYKSSLDLD
jgi:two-component system LytT family response regulator